MRYISRPVRKKDAMALVTGQPVYVDDLAPGIVWSSRCSKPPRLCQDRIHPHRQGEAGARRGGGADP